MFVNIFIQLIIEFSAQMICTFLEYKHSIHIIEPAFKKSIYLNIYLIYKDVPVLSATKNYKEFVPIFMYSSVMGALFCVIREFNLMAGTYFL